MVYLPAAKFASTSGGKVVDNLAMSVLRGEAEGQLAIGCNQSVICSIVLHEELDDDKIALHCCYLQCRAQLRIHVDGIDAVSIQLSA